LTLPGQAVHPAGDLSGDRSMPSLVRLSAALTLLLAVSPLAAAAAPADWSSPNRLVRFDAVAAGETDAFDAARRQWVAAVGAGKASADDGFALAWSATDGGRTTYMMLSPFARYADLDGRRDLDGASDGRADDAYADAPHHVQVWHRVDALSFPSPAFPALDEQSAGAVRVEVVTENDARKRSELVATWKEIAAALQSQKYPLAVVVYENRFVRGQLIWLWLARDAETLKVTQSVKTSMTWAVGDRRTRDLTVKINQLTEMTDHYPLTRRTDLSIR
jgi:hypothetical protein